MTLLRCALLTFPQNTHTHAMKHPNTVEHIRSLSLRLGTQTRHKTQQQLCPSKHRFTITLLSSGVERFHSA